MYPKCNVRPVLSYEATRMRSLKSFQEMSGMGYTSCETELQFMNLRQHSLNMLEYPSLLIRA